MDSLDCSFVISFVLLYFCHVMVYKIYSFYYVWQILLDDVKVSEQMLDLVIYLLIVLGGYEQVSI